MDTLLPRRPQHRARSFCALHATLNPRQRQALHSMMRTKRVFQNDVLRWLELHDQLRTLTRANPCQMKNASARQSLLQQQRRVVETMCSRLPRADKAKEVWDAIGKTKDQKVHAQLCILSNTASSLDEIAAARAELRARMKPRLQGSHWLHG